MSLLKPVDMLFLIRDNKNLTSGFYVFVFSGLSSELACVASNERRIKKFGILAPNTMTLILSFSQAI